jgi:hypothetical protein
MNAPKAATKPTATGPTFEDIRDELNLRIMDLCKDLLPDGHVNGGYWIARNPNRDDRTAGSFWVRIKSPVGVFKDEATGDTGDVIKLVRYLGQLPDYSATRDWCLKWLGWSRGEAARPTRPQRPAPAPEDDRAAEMTLAKNRRSALAMWLNAQVITAANLDATIGPYMAGRGIDLATHFVSRGRELPGAIRFLPAHDYRLAENRGKLSLPCMVALISGPDGKPVGVHRAWLSPDRAAKADLPDAKKNKPRKIWPAGWQGGVIRIAKGAGNLSPEQAIAKGKRAALVVTEGIEDALSVAIACPDHRVWAAGTLGNLGRIPVLECIARVIVCADNDWDKPQAMAELDAAIKTLGAQGVPVGVARSWRGKDVNDLIQGE